MRVEYQIIECALGRLLVAATDKGACAVKLGSKATALIEELRKEFPAALIEEGNDWTQRAASALLGQLKEGHSDTDIPMDLKGTDFQKMVWTALRDIPAGQTRSYAQFARGLGRPTAVRAVAQACATNPVAVLLPCHRVIGKNGKLTGYRWGLERKQKLLEIEANAE